MYRNEVGILLFSLMIFGMVLIVLFIILRARAQRKKDMMTAKEYEAKEEKLMLLYFEVEDMINGLKEYVENARQVLSLEYDRVQAQAQGLRIVQQVQQMPAAQPEPEPEPAEPEPEPEPEEPEPEQPTKKNLYDLAADMIRQGRSPAQIAEELNLSRSEVAIIERLAH